MADLMYLSAADTIFYGGLLAAFYFEFVEIALLLRPVFGDLWLIVVCIALVICFYVTTRCPVKAADSDKTE